MPEVPGGFLTYALVLAALLIVALIIWNLRLRSEIKDLNIQVTRRNFVVDVVHQSTAPPTRPVVAEEQRPPAFPSSDAAKPIGSSPQLPADVAVPLMEASSEKVEEPPFSEAHARELFARWCDDAARPMSTSQTEIRFLQYARSEPAKEFGGRPMHILREEKQVSEFVRFSRMGGGTGLLFPTPEAHFTPVMNHLFPTLTAAAMDNPAAIASIDPVHIRRRSPIEWERDD